MLLSDAQKREFKQNGFIIVNNAINVDLITWARDTVWDSLPEDPDDINMLLQNENPGIMADDVGGVYLLDEVLSTGKPMKAILQQARLYAEELVGENVLAEPRADLPETCLHNEGVNPIVRYPKPHVDWSDPNGTDKNSPYYGDAGKHVDGYGGDPTRVWSIGATVLLDHVQPRGGGTLVWPGSHRLMGEYFSEHSVDSLDNNSLPQVEFGEPFEVTGDPGTLLLWHNKLIHTGATNYSPRPRVAAFARLSRADIDEVKEDASGNIWKYWEGMEDISISPDKSTPESP
jgi:hypothetical protein